MSADLIEAFGSDTQFNDPQTREFLTPIIADRTKVISTEDRSIQILPTQRQEAIPVPLQPPAHGWSQPELDKDVLFDADIYEAAEVANTRNGDDEFGDFEQVNSGFIPVSSGLTSANFATQPGSLIDLDDHETSLPTHGLFTKGSKAASKPKANTNLPAMSHLIISEQTSSHTKQMTEDEDEWGQFEDVNSTDLISAVKHNRERSTGPQQLSKSAGSTSANKSGQRAKATDQPTLDQGQTSDDGFDEDWDQFDEEEPKLPAAIPTQSKGYAQNSVNVSARSQDVHGDRPTNVPPPAILLSLFPTVFSILCTQAEKKSSDDLGAQVLEAYRVCARIIACRQLRWKRDTVLAQSMRIGAAGRSGGMKLTTLDKGEARREEQDAQEAISAWSRSSHKLSAVMVKARTAKPPASLSTGLVMRVATGADVLTSNHICPICGLKRNERISGIDVNVADIFGEFWVEHWGHRDCHEVWYRYSHLLDQR